MSGEPAALPPLIQAMMRPGFFPHPARPVELRQTHISYVILAGDFVYKLKKPVRFSFLDYSTLERREHFCREEIRLNRRLAPAIYLDVLPIVQHGDAFEFSAGEEKDIIEYAVKMRRLPEEYFLDQMIREGKVRTEHLDRIADKLARFYATAATDRASLYGSAEFIGRNVGQNLTELEPFLGETLASEEYNELRDFNAAFLSKNAALLHNRVGGGRVREGHGDLRAEHICLETEPVIFDCIEFNEAFRYCDAASEIAFLSMDLDYLGVPLLADHLAASFQNSTRDPELARLLPFYKTYRACVRGKVETLKSREFEVPEGERNEAKARARRYFHLAYRYVRGPLPAAIVAVCGLTGSGKSTIARVLGARTGYQILNSDVVRKQMAGVPLTSHAREAYGAGLYSESADALTYERLVNHAESCLQTGKGVIIDATFKNPTHRRKLIELSARLRVPLFFGECRASEATSLRRLQEREKKAGEVSDATVEVYLRQRDEFVPLSEIPDSQRMILDTEEDAENGAKRAFDFLCRALSDHR